MMPRQVPGFVAQLRSSSPWTSRRNVDGLHRTRAAHPPVAALSGRHLPEIPTDISPGWVEEGRRQLGGLRARAPRQGRLRVHSGAVRSRGRRCATICRAPVHSGQEANWRPGHPGCVVPRVALCRGRPTRCLGRAHDGVGRDGRQRAAEQRGNANDERGQCADERDANELLRAGGAAGAGVRMVAMDTAGARHALSCTHASSGQSNFDRRR